MRHDHFLNRWALKAALKLIDFTGKGDHSFIYLDRVNDARIAVQEMLDRYHAPARPPVLRVDP